MSGVPTNLVGVKAIAAAAGLSEREIWDAVRHGTMPIRRVRQGNRDRIVASADDVAGFTTLKGMDAVARYLEIPIGTAYRYHATSPLPTIGGLVVVRRADLRLRWAALL